MSDPQPQPSAGAETPTPAAQPQAPQPPPKAEEASGGGGAFGAFMETFADEFASQMGVEWSELKLTDGPWLERSKIGWRVHNGGNTAIPSHNVFFRISENGVAIVEKEETKSKSVGADAYVDFELSVDEFNDRVKAELELKGDSTRTLREDARYRFDIFVDTSSGYDQAGSVEFGLELDEPESKGKAHPQRQRIERVKPDDVDDEAVDQDVLYLQELLKKLEYYTGAVDGRYGDSTEEAVAWFKQYEGLSGDGKVVGDRSWSLLHKRSDEHDSAGAEPTFATAKGFTY